MLHIMLYSGIKLKGKQSQLKEIYRESKEEIQNPAG